LHVKSAARVRVFVVFVATLAAPSLGQAATFTVNSTLDAVDAAPGDGICATAGAVCTLRAAIQEANALAGTDTIVVPAGTYTLTRAGKNENAAATGDLDITSTVIVQGAGADVTTVTAAGLDRVFEVTAGGNATLRGLRITGGNPTANGGGIITAGTLVVDRCAITGNTGSLGGGISNSGASTITITDSEISGNVATSQGGGVNLQATAAKTLTNVTVSGNSANNAVGGIIIFNGATITNVTIASNTDVGSLGHNLASASGTTTLRNTLIVTAQAGDNCYTASPVTDGGGNFAAGSACQTIAATAAVATNLGPRTVNSPGTTATHALLAGNPAIGGGVAAFCPSADQRGVTRVGAACDSGAYQFSAAAVPTPTPTPTPTGPGVAPAISTISDQMLQQDTAVSIPFTISGAIIAYALRTSATTSNPTLFPALASSTSCDPLGHCTLLLTPADGRAGSGIVTVTVSDGTLQTSQSFTATVALVRPSAPGVVLANVVGSGVTVTWSGLDPPPVAYAITWGRSNGAANLPMQLVPGSATRFDFLALPGGTYFFRVYAVGAGGLSGASPQTDAIVTSSGVPGPPMSLQGGAGSGLSANWAAPTIGATPILYEMQLGASINSGDVGSVTTPGLSLSSGLGAGTYWIRTRAAAGGSNGAWSSSVQIPVGAANCSSAPGAPTMLPVTTASGQVGFNWIPGAGSAADSYQVQIKLVGIPTFVLNTSTNGSSAIWDAMAGTFSARVVGVNACGIGVVSNEVDFTITP